MVATTILWSVSALCVALIGRWRETELFRKRGWITVASVQLAAFVVAGIGFLSAVDVPHTLSKNAFYRTFREQSQIIAAQQTNIQLLEARLGQDQQLQKIQEVVQVPGTVPVSEPNISTVPSGKSSKTSSKPQGLNSIKSKPDVEADFDTGVNTFTFGSSMEQVVDQLAGIVPHYLWGDDGSKIPRASEYGPADVRYFWTSLASLQQTRVGKGLLSELPDTKACLSGQSYIVFLFSEDRLIRVVTRLTPDCAERQGILKSFADKYGFPFNTNSAVLFQRATKSVTVRGYVSGDGVFSLDIFETGSPSPTR